MTPHLTSRRLQPSLLDRRLLNWRQHEGLAVDDPVGAIVIKADVIQIGVVADDGKTEIGGVGVDQRKIGVEETAFGIVGSDLSERDDQLRLSPVDQIGGGGEIQTWRAQFIVPIIPEHGDGYIRGLINIEPGYKFHVQDRRVHVLLGISDRAEVRVNE